MRAWKKSTSTLLVLLALASPSSVGGGAASLAAAPEGKATSPEAPKGLGAEEMAAMMERARRFTQPGEEHALLARFLGTWDTTTRVLMPGAKAERGVATFTWLMEGRWLQMKGEGSLMGMPHETFLLVGYDRFKQSYVVTQVSSMDTAMLRAEGDVDPKTGALIAYGTLDEYLTGEHDKMVRYVWRFPSEDRMVYEIHDLPIGETNAKVIEVLFERRASGEGEGS